ncbi:hypothetical protein ScPMuIL_018562 [Solemya velum]
MTVSKTHTYDMSVSCKVCSTLLTTLIFRVLTMPLDIVGVMASFREQFLRSTFHPVIIQDESQPSVPCECSCGSPICPGGVDNPAKTS